MGGLRGRALSPPTTGPQRNGFAPMDRTERWRVFLCQRMHDHRPGTAVAGPMSEAEILFGPCEPASVRLFAPA